jgi:ATP:ADP antiporter, AAA family
MKLPYAIKQLFDYDKSELRVVLLSASYFFLLLTAYYILRPIREAMGIARSAEDLPSLFIITMTITLLLAPLIGALVSKYKPHQFIPIAYRFIAANLILFFIALNWFGDDHSFYIGMSFYIWLTVINLLLISLFWGFMADGISFAESKRLFPSIAIGGTVGAILGGSIANQFVSLLGHAYLLLVAIVFLEVAVRLVKLIQHEFEHLRRSNHGLVSNDSQQTDPSINSSSKKSPSLKQDRQAQPNYNNDNDDTLPQPNQATGFKLWISGVRYVAASPYLLAIAGYIFFYGLTSTFIYFQQGELVASASQSSARRTQIFANIDILTNSLTLLLQLFISKQILQRFGIGMILIGLPIFTLLGFIALGIYPTLTVLVLFQAFRRALNYGLFKPAREILFTLIPSEQKYKAKSFLDTFVYRGGDAVGAVSQKVLIAFQIGVASIALLVVPIAIIWSALAIYLGYEANRKSQQSE